MILLGGSKNKIDANILMIDGSIAELRKNTFFSYTTVNFL